MLFELLEVRTNKHVKIQTFGVKVSKNRNYHVALT